jgi:hypothetical protein
VRKPKTEIAKGRLPLTAHALVQRLARDLLKRLKIPSRVLQCPSELLALHGNFVAAEAVKQVLFAAIPVDPKTRGLLPDEILVLGQFESARLRLQVFYALMYVVMEGYRELGCHDPEVDRLLAQSDLVEAFRRFRNATSGAISQIGLAFTSPASVSQRHWACLNAKGFATSFRRSSISRRAISC